MKLNHVACLLTEEERSAVIRRRIPPHKPNIWRARKAMKGASFCIIFAPS
jgi:hypothetical protein